MDMISTADTKPSPMSFGELWHAASNLVDRVFVPRELILRADDRVSYVRLSSGAQKLAAAILCAVTAWGAFASRSYLMHWDILAAKDRTIASQTAAYNDLEADFTRRIGDLEGRLARLRQAHKDVVERFSALAMIRADAMESSIAGTGLDADRLVSSIARAGLGRGGPLIPIREATANLDQSAGLTDALADLNEQWNRLFALQEARRILPLTAPLSQYWISSGYGERKDPFTGKPSHHSGVDMAAPLGSSIRATAPGRVVFAGKRKRYGRMIEIDHGHGIATRYAHLGKVLVKEGQRIERGQKIGALGNSGRSTGPHLHYEVRSRDQELNPVKFLEAGTQPIEG